MKHWFPHFVRLFATIGTFALFCHAIYNQGPASRPAIAFGIIFMLVAYTFLIELTKEND